MTKLKFGEKELQIKFGYEATVKSGIIKKVAKLDQMEDIEAVDEILLFLPELILVGAQKFHKEKRKMIMMTMTMDMRMITK